METDKQERMKQADMSEPDIKKETKREQTRKCYQRIPQREDQCQMSYLMSPYTHYDKEVMKARVDLANIAAASLIQDQNRIVFSPLSHSHYIQETGIPKNSHELWLRQGDFFLDFATELVLLCVQGWDESEGVRHEIHRGIVQNRSKLEVMIPMIEDKEKSLISFFQMEIVIPWDVPEWLAMAQGHYTSAIIEAIMITIELMMVTRHSTPMTPTGERNLTRIMNMVIDKLNKQDPTRLSRTRSDIT